ncbi:hypothetical protein ACQP2Y_35220 [Actinoplanes sp. CA-051413]|uniref:hypothetical protein n=1 Tax=Actinoplanes sp. CA-051413 TaxID=3239899 RepID=UPI003D953DD8
MTSPLQSALRSLVREALHELASVEGTPTFADLPDNRGWNRFGQREFGALRRNAWRVSPELAHYRWFDRFPAMAKVRSIVATDAALHERLEIGAGVEFSMSGPQNLGPSVTQHLIEPMVRSSRSYEFDEHAFSEAFATLLRGLTAARARLVEFVPMNALRVTSDVTTVELSDDLTLRAMSDQQVSAAIMRHAVPAEFLGGPTFVSVEPDHQWALSVESNFPIISASEMPKHPTAGPFPVLDGPAERLVKALRVVCGGSVVSTRSVRLQHDDDFPLLSGPTAVLTSLSAVDFTRPTLLTGDDVVEVSRLFAWLDEPGVRADRLLSVTLDRLVIGGAQRDPAQRLTDLMTCLEMIFIKRAGLDDTRQKSIHIRRGAARLLADDPAIGATRSEIENFIAAAYKKRNDYMHGDDPNSGTLVLIDAGPAASLTEMVDAAELVTRRAVHLTITGTASP